MIKVQPLLDYGDENIDPFSFFYSLAQRSQDLKSRERIYPSIEKAFKMKRQLPVESDDAFVFPMPPYNALVLFHNDGQGNPQLLWSLFRRAVRGLGSVKAGDFDGALDIGNVGIAKLTQVLFLINPAAFLPYDDTTRSLGIHDLQIAVNWTQYQEELQRFRNAFPGCAFYEINLFSHLWKKYWKNREDRKKFHVSTNTYNDGRDFWKDTDPELDFEPNHWVFTGGAGPNHRPYPLCDPQSGDVMLVRNGISQGRGIGIVYRNDHRDQNHFDESRRIHVVWVNKKLGELAGATEQLALNYAGNRTLDAFRQASAYKETFALLGLSEEPMANQGTPQIPDVKHPLNQILYGPPGTGKTYHAVACALAIVDGVSVRERGEGDVERFHELRECGQVTMATFHQSYAYEDFIEGIRPVLDDEVSGQIRYKMCDGIFKQIVKVADEERRKGGG